MFQLVRTVCTFSMSPNLSPLALHTKKYHPLDIIPTSFNQQKKTSSVQLPTPSPLPNWQSSVIMQMKNFPRSYSCDS